MPKFKFSAFSIGEEAAQGKKIAAEAEAHYNSLTDSQKAARAAKSRESNVGQPLNQVVTENETFFFPPRHNYKDMMN